MIRIRPVLAILLSLGVGCAGSELASRVTDTRSTVQAARKQGAYQCAPTELASAETALESAEKELDRGEYFRARDALDVAREATQKAFALTKSEACAKRVSPPAPPRARAARADDDKGFLDSDGDGIPDHHDHCPDVPEDQDGFEDEDGCPDLDNDGDGVLDTQDACPLEPEDRDGFEDTDGCPDLDNDKDGVVDGKDKCPNDAEDVDRFEDEDGCPDPDNDRDGIADHADACPNDYGPENPNGCPKPFAFIEVTTEKIELKQVLLFRTGKAVILAKSYPILGEVVMALRARPALRLSIEGHTDSRGNRSHNLALSQARAESVREYLIGQGISGDRLEARGYGPDRPLDSNASAKGRERNRRVEFLITKQ